jgi:hypothetical protein
VHTGKFRSGNARGTCEYDFLLSTAQLPDLTQQPSAEILVTDVLLGRQGGIDQRCPLQQPAATVHVTVEVDAEAECHGRQKGTESISVQRGVGGSAGHGLLNAVLGVLEARQSSSNQPHEAVLMLEDLFPGACSGRLAGGMWCHCGLQPVVSRFQADESEADFSFIG